MQYLTWRVMAGLNQRVEISFMMVGHTKFAPDWAFGLLKQKFRRTQVGCLDDLVRVVEESASINHAQLVGKENGEVIVKQYDWASSFRKFFKRKAFEGIKSLHHLVFSSSSPGVVKVRKETDGEVETIHVLSKAGMNWKPSPHVLPDQIVPPGLSRERQTYLYEKIREFVPDGSKDKVCPKPLHHGTPISTACPYIGQSPTPSPSPSPLPKRRRH
jgi:hypothetical protein